MRKVSPYKAGMDNLNMKPSSVGIHFTSSPDSFDAYMMAMMQMGSGHEVVLDDN